MPQKDDELRRQIQTKEQEIKNLAKTSEHLRRRLDESVAKLPERDRSPVQPPVHMEQHAQNLQNDNTSIMRRLNLVLQELERIQKEKDELKKQYIAACKTSQELQQLVNGEDNMDKANRYMHDDLAYEKDRNSKLHAKVQDEELVKNRLLAELGQQREDAE